jgi:tetratricopeptide (TPR) repeat protein
MSQNTEQHKNSKSDQSSTEVTVSGDKKNEQDNNEKQIDEHINTFDNVSVGDIKFKFSKEEPQYDEEGNKKLNIEDFLDLAKDLRLKGNEHFHKERYPAALQQYIECTKYLDGIERHVKLIGTYNFEKELINTIINQRVTTYTNIGLCYIRLQKYQNALTYLNQALREDETSSKALYLRAKLYYICDYYSEAQQDIAALLEVQPKNKEGLQLKISIDKGLEKVAEQSQIQKHMYAQRYRNTGDMSRSMNIQQMMNMMGTSMWNREDIEQQEMEKALELSLIEYQKEEARRKEEEERQKKVDDAQEEMRKYFELMAINKQAEKQVEETGDQEEEDEDDFVIDDEDEYDGDSDDVEDDEPVDNDPDDE